MILVNILATLLLAFLILALIYIFVLVRPSKNKPVNISLFTEYAHRGLHGKNIPENSLLAFEKAVEEKVGIELDVQLTKDGKVVVFHDYTLLRMTGVDKNVCDVEYSEISKLSLLETDEKIPAFEQVLSVVNGKVPLLIELKGENLDTSLCEKVARLLKKYKGNYCIESFNPLMINKIKEFLPEVYCGQLYTNVCRDKGKKSFLYVLLSMMALNFLSRPDFIAYNKADRYSFPVKLTTGFYKAPSFVWTIKGETEREEAKKNGEFSIFEEVKK